MLQSLLQDGPRSDDLFVLHLVTTYALAQLVEALRYQPEGSGFDSRWVNDLILPAPPLPRGHLSP